MPVSGLQTIVSYRKGAEGALLDGAFSYWDNLKETFKNYDSTSTVTLYSASTSTTVVPGITQIAELPSVMPTFQTYEKDTHFSYGGTTYWTSSGGDWTELPDTAQAKDQSYLLHQKSAIADQHWSLLSNFNFPTNPNFAFVLTLYDNIKPWTWSNYVTLSWGADIPSATSPRFAIILDNKSQACLGKWDVTNNRWKKVMELDNPYRPKQVEEVLWEIMHLRGKICIRINWGNWQIYQERGILINQQGQSIPNEGGSSAISVPVGHFMVDANWGCALFGLWQIQAAEGWFESKEIDMIGTRFYDAWIDNRNFVANISGKKSKQPAGTSITVTQIACDNPKKCKYRATLTPYAYTPPGAPWAFYSLPELYAVELNFPPLWCATPFYNEIEGIDWSDKVKFIDINYPRELESGQCVINYTPWWAEEIPVGFAHCYKLLQVWLGYRDTSFAVLGFRSNPPVSPLNGDTYIVQSGVGAWLGKDDYIAVYVSASDSWSFMAPVYGSAFVVAGGNTYRWNGTSWQDMGDLGECATYDQIGGGFYPFTGYVIEFTPHRTSKPNKEITVKLVDCSWRAKKIEMDETWATLDGWEVREAIKYVLKKIGLNSDGHDCYYGITNWDAYPARCNLFVRNKPTYLSEGEPEEPLWKVTPGESAWNLLQKIAEYDGLDLWVDPVGVFMTYPKDQYKYFYSPTPIFWGDYDISGGFPPTWGYLVKDLTVNMEYEKCKTSVFVKGMDLQGNSVMSSYINHNMEDWNPTYIGIASAPWKGWRETLRVQDKVYADQVACAKAAYQLFRQNNQIPMAVKWTVPGNLSLTRGSMVQINDAERLGIPYNMTVAGSAIPVQNVGWMYGTNSIYTGFIRVEGISTHWENDPAKCETIYEGTLKWILTSAVGGTLWLDPGLWTYPSEELPP